jgi:hypothetical protein
MSTKLEMVRLKVVSLEEGRSTVFLYRVSEIAERCIGRSGHDPVIRDDDAMTLGEVIQNFLDSDKNILLLPLKDLVRDIILPPHSTVLIVDTVVRNVQNYIFQKIRTDGEDTLSKAMYITEDTIEELIAVEPEYEDEYDMMDADGNFAGQVFQRQYRSLALLKATQDLMLQTDLALYVPFEDPGEEAEQDVIF